MFVLVRADRLNSRDGEKIMISYWGQAPTVSVSGLIWRDKGRPVSVSVRVVLVGASEWNARWRLC